MNEREREIKRETERERQREREVTKLGGGSLGPGGLNKDQTFFLSLP